MNCYKSCPCFRKLFGFFMLWKKKLLLFLFTRVECRYIKKLFVWGGLYICIYISLGEHFFKIMWQCLRAERRNGERVIVTRTAGVKVFVIFAPLLSQRTHSYWRRRVEKEFKSRNMCVQIKDNIVRSIFLDHLLKYMPLLFFFFLILNSHSLRRKRTYGTQYTITRKLN